MKILLSGLLGALIASVLSVLYQYFAEQKRIRKELMLDVVGWVDDVYDLLQAIHVQKQAAYSGGKLYLTEEEYRGVSRNLKFSLISTKLEAKVAIIYGEGEELRLTKALKGEILKTVQVLWAATKDTWVEDNKLVFESFSKRIDPLRGKVEKTFLIKGKFKTIAGEAFKINQGGLMSDEQVFPQSESGNMANDIEIWKQAIETQIHFNELIIKMRMTVISIIITVFGAAGIALKDLNIYAQIFQHKIHISIVIITIGLIFLIVQFIIDRFYYFKLLLGAVKFTEALDKKYASRSIFGLTTEINKTISHTMSGFIVIVYYFIPFIMGIVAIYLIQYKLIIEKVVK